MFQRCEICLQKFIKSLWFSYRWASMCSIMVRFSVFIKHTGLLYRKVDCNDLWCEKQLSYINNLVPACLHSDVAWWRDRTRNTVWNQYGRSLDTHTPTHTVHEHIISFVQKCVTLGNNVLERSTLKSKRQCQSLRLGWMSWHDVGRVTASSWHMHGTPPQHY